MDNLNIIPKPECITYEDITELLHKAYTVRIKEGLKYNAATQSAEVTKNRVGNGTCLIAIIDEELVGTITCNIYNCYSKKYSLKYDKNFYIISQFAVKPYYKHRGIGKKLIEYVEDLAQKNNCDAIYGDTASSAKQLLSWYDHLDYLKIGFLSHPNTNYYSVVFRKTINGKSMNNFFRLCRYNIKKLFCIISYRKDGEIRLLSKIIKKLQKNLTNNME
ncbi:MAG: GNAT family N-acetyltransferase [Bacilli bacterium]|nr:GNAT family N-acetyltransferase [Bacilli bacterium]